MGIWAKISVHMSMPVFMILLGHLSKKLASENSGMNFQRKGNWFT